MYMTTSDRKWGTCACVLILPIARLLLHALLTYIIVTFMNYYIVQTSVLHTLGLNLCGPLSAGSPQGQPANTHHCCHSGCGGYHRVWRWGLQRGGCLQWSCSQRELCVCLCEGGYVCVRGWEWEAYSIQYHCLTQLSPLPIVLFKSKNLVAKQYLS